MARPRTRTTQPAANEVSEVVHAWFARSLNLSGMQQVVLARRLTEMLDRNVSGIAVNRMLHGHRAIAADEMMAAARIFRVPLPSPNERRTPQPRLPRLEQAA